MEKYNQIICGICFLLACNTTSACICHHVQPTETVDPPPIPPKYPEMGRFLDDISDCDWCVACGSYARYTRLEAEKKNITLYEVTIKDDDPNRVKRTLVSGHRINYFYTADNRRVYVDNTHNWRVILEGNEIKAHIKSRFGIDLNTVSFST